MKLFVENISFKPRTNYCLDFSTSHRGRNTKPNFQRKAAIVFFNIVKKCNIGGGWRYVPRFVSPLSIFSEGAIWKPFRNFQTFKFNSGAIKWLFQNRFDIDKTVLHVLLSSKLNGGWYIENRECHKSFDFPASFPPLTRFWTWTDIDQTFANPITVPKTQVKPGQSFFFFTCLSQTSNKGNLPLLPFTFFLIKFNEKESLRWQE